MRLFEAIIDANHRATGGDASAGLRPAEFADSLPVAALTCIDPRLNPLIPGVLGIPEDQFVWLRNAGNLVTSPMSSTMRSLALACAVEGAREIAIIGHTDCLVGKTNMLQLLEQFAAFGVERRNLPENLTDFFGLFSSERQNVIRACEIVRRSPLIGPKIPVHGLIADVHTGRLEWIVNGYEQTPGLTEKWNETVRAAGQTVEALKSSLADFQIGDIKFPETKIGETVTRVGDVLAQKLEQLEVQPAPPDGPAGTSTAASIAEKIIQAAEKHWPRPPETSQPPPATPPKLPTPIRPKPKFKR
jgi:carbonic anhydrase